MDRNGYRSVKDLRGVALELFNMSEEKTKKRQNMLGEAYRTTQVDTDKCIGCGRCEDVCWYKGIKVENRKAQKTENCIGCGYCFQVCPVKALHVDAPAILKKGFEEN
jgi:dihydropyrimidine dehydrogenase (NAD+) subunit PreA